MSSFFCPLPFIHQFVCTDGTAVCCRISERKNLNVIDFENSDYVKTMRNQFEQNIIPSQCNICKNDEEKGFYTVRQQAIKDFGYTKGPSFQYLDLRYDNLCNLACRMCNSAYSSLWAKEIDNNPELTEFQSPFKRNNVSSQVLDNFHLIKDNLKKISLTGGEPLLIKDHLTILELLISNQKTDVELTITSNLTSLTPKWLSLISKFETVHWTVSIDAVQEVGEYIRWPNYSWDIIDKNLDKILNLNHSVSINCTLTIYSLLDINSLVDYYVTKVDQTKNPFELWFSVAWHPAALSINAVPLQFKNKIICNLEIAIEKLKTIRNHEHSVNTLQGVLNSLQSLTNYELSKDFFRYTELLDKSRNQDFNKTFQNLIN
jgi:uncharacterized Fe-S cluster-containing radical SAM superfamily protein